MVEIIGNDKKTYKVVELTFKQGYTHCTVCMRETYNYVMLYDQKYCPGCAIEYLIEPTCSMCGNYLRSEPELQNGCCDKCN